jgi:alpha-tubulin suppressor-like RCC1 family protein
MGSSGRWLGKLLSVFVVGAVAVGSLPLVGVSASADSAVELRLGDASIVEGDSGPRRVVRVRLSLDAPHHSDLFVTWQTRDVTATADEDYRPRARTTRIRAGRTERPIALAVYPDTVVEGDETFEVEITAVSDPDVVAVRDVGTITIIDDDPSDGPELAVGDAAVVEGNEGFTTAQVPLTLNEPLDDPLEVTWTTVDGTAVAEEDYQPRARTTRIRAGRTRVLLPVRVYGDLEPEIDETFFISITGTVGSDVPVGRPTGTVTILNDDADLPPPPPTGNELAAWGDNSYWQLGLTRFAQPQRVDAGVWSSVSAGGSDYSNTFTVAVRDDGTLWTWGTNTTGQLGLGDSGAGTNRTVPTQVGTDTNWVSVSAGSSHVLGVRADGTLWAWGANASGRTGLGTTTGSTTVPTQVGTATTWATVSAAGGESFSGPHSLAVRTDGTAWAWGSNANGRTGLGTTTGSTLTPTQVGTDGDWVTVSAGSDYSLGIRSDGTAWAWGSNWTGATGLRTTINPSATPVQVSDATWASVEATGHSVAIAADGELWGWGAGLFPHLVGGDVTVPTTAQPGTTWSQVAAGFRYSLAVATDGTLWAWGSESGFGSGWLGLGPGYGGFAGAFGVPPTQVGSDTDWVSVVTGVGNYVGDCCAPFSLGIRANGTLWAWGSNDDGELGLGDSGWATTRNVPTQVGTATNWAAVVANNNYGGIGGHVLGIRTDGTLWAWGANNNGQLGLGDSGWGTNRTVPTQVGGDNDWTKVTAGPGFSLAIRADGTLWAWGRNEFGLTGLGVTTGNTTVPTQVGSANDWLSISAAQSHVVGIRANGTLWAWGRNFAGQLGVGDTTDRSTPTQVGGDSDWAKVASGDAFSLAIRADGTMWAWGANGGRLGVGDTDGRLVPTPVGSDTSWTAVTAGSTHSFGLRALPE